MTIVGHCPKCGAPIYGEAEVPDFKAIDAEKRLGGEGPEVVYSCVCRLVQPMSHWRPHVVTSPNSNPVPLNVSGTAEPYIGPPVPWIQS